LLPAAVLERLCRAEPAPAGPCPFTAARVPAALLAEPLSVDAGDLAALCAGDVVLMPSLRRPPLAGPATLCFERFRLEGTLSGTTFTVASLADAQPQEIAVDDPNPLPPPLPLSVQVELARVLVPLSELSRIKPGAVLELDVTLEEPVVLRVGDRAIARAELVDIEGEIGARILSLI
jgi:type III secretion protein Q